MKLEPTRTANSVAFIYLVREYLPVPDSRTHTWEVEGVTIHARLVANRSGVPDDAKTYVLTVDAADWTIEGRAVWRGDHLHAPAAVHTTVVRYVAPDVDPDCPEDELVARANAWLKGAL